MGIYVDREGEREREAGTRERKTNRDMQSLRQESGQRKKVGHVNTVAVKCY